MVLDHLCVRWHHNRMIFGHALLSRALSDQVAVREAEEARNFLVVRI